MIESRIYRSSQVNQEAWSSFPNGSHKPNIWTIHMTQVVCICSMISMIDEQEGSGNSRKNWYLKYDESNDDRLGIKPKTLEQTARISY